MKSPRATPPVIYWFLLLAVVVATKAVTLWFSYLADRLTKIESQLSFIEVKMEVKPWGADDIHFAASQPKQD